MPVESLCTRQYFLSISGHRSILGKGVDNTISGNNVQDAPTAVCRYLIIVGGNESKHNIWRLERKNVVYIEQDRTICQ